MFNLFLFLHCWTKSSVSRHAEVCRGRAPKWSDEGQSRAEQRILAQLRAGKSPLLAGYRSSCRFEGTPSPACACGAAGETARHLVLECPRYVQARNRLFEPPLERAGMEVLARAPERAVRFLRDIGRSTFKGIPRMAPRARRPRRRQKK